MMLRIKGGLEMNFDKVMEKIIDFFSTNSLYLLGLLAFMFIVIIGFIADRRARLKKLNIKHEKKQKISDNKKENIKHIIKEKELEKNQESILKQEPQVEENVLQPAIDIDLSKEENIMQPSQLNYDIENNLDTMKATIVISPEIEEIFRNFKFPSFEKKDCIINEKEKTNASDIYDNLGKTGELGSESNKIGEEDFVVLKEKTNKIIEPLIEEILDVDTTKKEVTEEDDIEDFKPDRLITDNTKVYNSETEEINNIF